MPRTHPVATAPATAPTAMTTTAPATTAAPASPAQPAPRRKDAARNRERLLASARQLVTARGLEVTLKEVAHHAGVGTGTVYRHFPAKDHLVAALFSEQLDREVERAHEAARAGDAWAALVTYLEETMRLQASDRGLRALMCPQGSAYDPVRECKAAVSPCVERVVELAHEQGTLRPDCTARDIVYLQVALVGIMDASPADQPDLYRHHLELLLDGVRADGEHTAPDR